MANYIEILKAGNKINISGKNVTPSTFVLVENNKVYIKNRELGKFEHKEFTESPEKLNKHIENMLESGLTVKISKI